MLEKIALKKLKNNEIHLEAMSFVLLRSNVALVLLQEPFLAENIPPLSPAVPLTHE